MVKITDVAKKAGVSVGTVSNVLNNLPSVSDKNRTAVNAAVRELGYTKNNAASQLRSNISNSIGLIIPDITNPFYPEIARGVQDTAESEGYNVFLCNSDRNIESEKRAVQALLGKKADGIIMLKPRIDFNDAEKIKKQCVLVLMDMNPALADCDIINVDNYGGMTFAVRKAYELGHRRIAFIAGRNDSMSSQSRRQAFRDSVRELNLPQPPGYFGEGSYTFESGERCFEEFMRLDEPPTAIIAANDLMAKGVLFKAYEMGIRVPGDISVIGCDDIDEARYSIPPLTTTMHPKYELGREGANLLFKRIKEQRRCHGKGEFNREVITLQTELIIRKTLAPPEYS